MPPLRWYIVFEDGYPWAWTPLLKPGFGHVWAIREYAGLWTIVNPGLHGLEVETFDAGDEVLTVAHFVGERASIVIEAEGRRNPGRMRLPWLLTPWTCVEVIKGLLGLRAWWVLTPWQLAKFLLKEDSHGRRWRLERPGQELPATAAGGTRPSDP